MFTDMFLYGLIVPVLPFMLEERVHTPKSQIQSYVSTLLAVYAAASMVASPVSGILADKLSSSRQLPFLLGLIILALATVLLAVGQSIVVLTIARLLQGASSGVVWTVGLALLVETVGPENLGKAIGSIFSVLSVATLLAPVLGGILYAKTGYGGVFGLGVAFLALDFLMRLLVIEKKVAAKYSPPTSPSCASTTSTTSSSDPEVAPLTESTPLLANPCPFSQSPYHLQPPKTALTRTLPILLCLRNPSLLTALFLGLIQALLLGAFDATVPLVASTRYNFDSLSAGLLFLPLGASDLLLGPLFGWAVDRYGTKPLAVLGYTYLVPALTLLRLPRPHPAPGQTPQQVALFAALLALSGAGLAVISAPALVEAGAVVERFWKVNPALFGDRGPYAQLYGFNSMVWSGGLTLGPLVAGGLRERIGYGNMCAVLAGVCAVTAGLAVGFVEGTPREWWRRWRERREIERRVVE